MPKLIIDEAANRIAMEKLAGRPIFGGPEGGLLAPGIVDLLKEDDGDAWQPADDRTRLLVLGAEACRDLVHHAGTFAEAATRPRTWKSMSVPVCSLMDVVSKLRAKLNDEESRRARQAWPKHDRDLYKQVGKRFNKKRVRGPVRAVRNKIGAHLDPEAFDGGRVKLKVEDLLGAMGDSLILFMLCLNHRTETFSWIRGHGLTKDGQHRLVETMFGFPAAVCWVTDLDGHVKDVSIVRIAEDPRWEVQESLLAAVRVYNEMVSATGLPIPAIWTRPTDELREAESSISPP